MIDDRLPWWLVFFVLSAGFALLAAGSFVVLGDRNTDAILGVASFIFFCAFLWSLVMETR